MSADSNIRPELTKSTTATPSTSLTFRCLSAGADIAVSPRDGLAYDRPGREGPPVSQGHAHLHLTRPEGEKAPPQAKKHGGIRRLGRISMAARGRSPQRQGSFRTAARIRPHSEPYAIRGRKGISVGENVPADAGDVHPPRGTLTGARTGSASLRRRRRG